MKQLKLSITSIFMLVIISFAATAQTKFDVAWQHISSTKAKYGLTDADLVEAHVTSMYTSKHNGITHIYMQQRHQGIDVENAFININIDKKNKVVTYGNSFVANLATKITGAATLSPVQAAEKLLTSLGKTPTQLLFSQQQVSLPATTNKKHLLGTGGVAFEPISAKLTYMPTEDGKVQLSYEIDFYTKDQQNYWRAKVGANDGKIIDRRDMVLTCAFGPAAESDLSGKMDFSIAAEMLRTQNTKRGYAKSYKVFSPELYQQAQPKALVAQAAFTQGTYRVYKIGVESPTFGVRELVTNVVDVESSPLGWHDDGFLPLEYPTTKGNNVWAYWDTIGVGVEAGLSPVSTTFNFDYPVDLTKQPQTYTDAAVTNLFYWNNLMHDVLYHYGFTEPAGNLQFSNFTSEGADRDFVLAQAQDGAGLNNANQLTLADGIPARMQMYLWKSSPIAKNLKVNSPASIAGLYDGVEAAFTRSLNETGVTGKLVLADPELGCGPNPTGEPLPIPTLPDPVPTVFVPARFNNTAAITGNIAVVKRGSCSFVEKVSNAQLSGATAVIVINNSAAAPISMGGGQTNALITMIPAIMISQADGDKLLAAMAAGDVNVTLSSPGGPLVLRDGDFDNTIIAHEYGHSVSIRLTGGPNTSCLSGSQQAGEGWSDFFGLYMTAAPGQTRTTARGLATYVVSQPPTGGGIRPRPYTTDMGVNEYTYAMMGRPEITVPHGVGFMFATVLWEMYWNLVDKYGYDDDKYFGKGGNNIALQLVMDGLKLQPCAPNFITSRDAIIAADIANNNGANLREIWTAFAKRGLGFSAKAGNLVDNEEAFDLPPDLVAGGSLTVKLDATPNPVVKGADVTYNVTVTNSTLNPIQAIEVNSTLDQGLNVVNSSISDGGQFSNGKVRFPFLTINPSTTKVLSFRATANTTEATTVKFLDNVESGGSKWTVGQVTIPGTPATTTGNWSIVSTKAKSGTKSWFMPDPDGFSNATLTLTNPITVVPNMKLSFWHFYNTEEGFDGGVVEISTNGTVWTDLGPNFTQNGYNGEIPAENASPIQGPAYTGSSGGFIQTIADLNSFAGQNIRIRYRFASDVLSAGEGWYVDDMFFYVEPVVELNARVNLTAGQITGTDSTKVLVTDVPTSVNDRRASAYEFRMFPNPTTDGLFTLMFNKNASSINEIEISNMFGQSVMKLDPTIINGQIRIDASTLPKGIYTITMKGKEGIRTERLIIQ